MSDNEVPEIDLDFHVEFPVPGDLDGKNIWPAAQQTEKMSGDGKKEEEKTVLVVLLGWAGAEDKHLAKYSDLYLKRGCIVLRYIAPLRVIFYEPGKLPVYANRVVRLLKDLQLHTHPTFFHVFSNGGSFLYSYILKELAAQKNPAEFNFRGTVFDSAPAPRSLKSVYHAMSNIFASYTYTRHIIASIIVLMLMAQVFWHHMRQAFRFCVVGERLERPTSVDKKTELAPLQDWLTRISKLRNHAFTFIYSDIDKMIPCEGLEKVAGALQDRGNPVTLVKFNDSEHVQHFRKYPEEYIGAITRFIRQRMETNDGPTIYWDEYN